MRLEPSDKPMYHRMDQRDRALIMIPVFGIAASLGLFFLAARFPAIIGGPFIGLGVCGMFGSAIRYWKLKQLIMPLSGCCLEIQTSCFVARQPWKDVYKRQSRLRIEKLDSETGENILHEGALFKIYAAKRDVIGNGASGVTGSGDILFDEEGTPLYEEREQIFMQDDTGAEVGVFKAYTTIRDGEVEGEDGSLHTEKQCVGYLETYQPLGAGAYVLVEVEAPDGYVDVYKRQYVYRLEPD